MSMLLMIYSLGNLHVVSWGTRESKSDADNKNGGKGAKDRGEYSCGIGTLCKLVY